LSVGSEGVFANKKPVVTSMAGFELRAGLAPKNLLNFSVAAVLCWGWLTRLC
jgi:hypothetical protein